VSVNKEIERTLQSLKSRNLDGEFADSSEVARKKIFDLVPKGAVVATGDSTTVAQLGVKEELRRRGLRLVDGFDRETERASVEDRWRLLEESTVCDVFLTGTNAITQDGRLVNVDGAGNRVAGMFWGHKMAIIVVGRNKIVRDLDEAFYRVRNVIAPSHIRIRGVELGGARSETPCVVTGKCSDCRSKDRRCNVFSIIEGKPARTDLKVVIVDEDLGLGWDESWPQERIAKIIENYKRFVWVPM